MEIDPNDLHVNCAISDDNQPLVLWAYQGKHGTMTVSEARSKAQAIFSAAAIAESEAAILEGMRAISGPKGFGKKQKQSEDEMLAKLLMLIRDFRPTLPDGLQVIYGHHTRQPLLVIEETWYGTEIQFPPAQAIGHAMHLVGAAEAGQSDAFLYYFLGDTIGIEKPNVAGVIQEFSLFRQRNELEDLFRSDRNE